MRLCQRVQKNRIECKIVAATDCIDLENDAKEKQRIREMVENVLDKIPNQLLVVNGQSVKDSLIKPVAEKDIDRFLDIKRAKIDNDAAKKRKLTEEYEEIKSLSSVSSVEVIRPFPSINVQANRPSPDMAKLLREQTFAILNAKAKWNRIQAFCFFCGHILTFDFVQWKLHILSHTGEVAPKEDTYFHDGYRLKGYMCKICDYFKVNEPRVIEHIMKEHGKTQDWAKNMVEMLILMPNLRRFKYPITTIYRHISPTHRYRCSIRGCDLNCGNSTNFRQHLISNHRQARTYNCIHCQKMIHCENGSSEAMLNAVINHILLHSSIVIECSVCTANSTRAVFSSVYNVLTHMLMRHGAVNMMYRRDHRDAMTVHRMEEVIVLFECGQCKSRFDTSAEALWHYAIFHNSHHADHKLIQLKKQSATENDLVSYSMEDIDQKFRLQQHFFCRRCQTYHKTKRSLIDHHNLMHQPNYLATEFKHCLINDKFQPYQMEQNMVFDQYLLYYCGHCNDSTIFIDADEVYDHWLDNHNEEGKPFRFCVAQLAQCHWCEVFSTFEGLKKHQMEQHSASAFIVKDFIDQSKCGLCLADGDGSMQTHFENNHQTVLKAELFSPIPLSNYILQKLVYVEGQKKYKCGYCAEIFETKDEFQSHHSKKHFLAEPDSEKLYDNQSMHLIAGCCGAKLEPKKLFGHFKKHKIMSEVRLTMYYWETKVVFGNGLMLNKQNLLGTKLNDTNEFETFLNDFINNKRF